MKYTNEFFNNQTDKTVLGWINKIISIDKKILENVSTIEAKAFFEYFSTIKEEKKKYKFSEFQSPKLTILKKQIKFVKKNFRIISGSDSISPQFVERLNILVKRLGNDTIVDNKQLKQEIEQQRVKDFQNDRENKIGIITELLQKYNKFHIKNKKNFKIYLNRIRNLLTNKKGNMTTDEYQNTHEYQDLNTVNHLITYFTTDDFGFKKNGFNKETSNKKNTNSVKVLQDFIHEITTSYNDMVNEYNLKNLEIMKLLEKYSINSDQSSVNSLDQSSVDSLQSSVEIPEELITLLESTQQLSSDLIMGVIKEVNNQMVLKQVANIKKLVGIINTSLLPFANLKNEIGERKVPNYEKHESGKVEYDGLMKRIFDYDAKVKENKESYIDLFGDLKKTDSLGIIQKDLKSYKINDILLRNLQNFNYKTLNKQISELCKLDNSKIEDFSPWISSEKCEFDPYDYFHHIFEYFQDTDTKKLFKYREVPDDATQIYNNDDIDISPIKWSDDDDISLENLKEMSILKLYVRLTTLIQYYRSLKILQWYMKVYVRVINLESKIQLNFEDGEQALFIQLTRSTGNTTTELGGNFVLFIKSMEKLQKELFGQYNKIIGANKISIDTFNDFNKLNDAIYSLTNHDYSNLLSNSDTNAGPKISDILKMSDNDFNNHKKIINVKMNNIIVNKANYINQTNTGKTYYENLPISIKDKK